MAKLTADQCSSSTVNIKQNKLTELKENSLRLGIYFKKIIKINTG